MRIIETLPAPEKRLIGTELQHGKVYRCVENRSNPGLVGTYVIVIQKVIGSIEDGFTLLDLRKHTIYKPSSDVIFYQEVPQGTRIVLEVE